MKQTKLNRETVFAIRAWCRRRKLGRVLSVRHVYPRAYVIGRMAERTLLISVPWVDAESHMRERERQYPTQLLSEFDSSLVAGQWCSAAYVSTTTSGQTVAIPVVEG